MANMELTFEQVLVAIRNLPDAQKFQVWRILDAEFDRNEIRRRARRAVEAIWADNVGVNEDEVMADIDTALAEIRAAQPARRS